MRTYVNWNSIYHKFQQWIEQGIFINILQEWNSGKSVLIEIDSTYCKVHQYGFGARKIYGNRAIGVSRGGKNTKMTAKLPLTSLQIRRYLQIGRMDIERFFNKLKNDRHITMRFDKLLFLDYSDYCNQNQITMSFTNSP